MPQIRQMKDNRPALRLAKSLLCCSVYGTEHVVHVGVGFINSEGITHELRLDLCLYTTRCQRPVQLLLEDRTWSRG